MFTTSQPPASSTMQQSMTTATAVTAAAASPAYQPAGGMAVDSAAGSVLYPVATTDSAGPRRLPTDAAPVVGVDNDDPEIASLVVSKEEVAARDSRQALFCTLDQLIQMVEVLLKQIGCRGIMAASAPDWDAVSEAVSLPAAACEYIIWNYQPSHYRHSLRMIVMDWNSAHKGVTFDRMQERDIDATRQAIVARAKVLLNYLDRSSMVDEDDMDDTMADYPRALRVPSRSNPQQPAAAVASSWQQPLPPPQQQPELPRGAYAATPYGSYYDMYSNASMVAGSEQQQQQQQPPPQ